MNPIFQNNRQQQPINNNPLETLSQMISSGQNPQQILQQMHKESFLFVHQMELRFGIRHGIMWTQTKQLIIEMS